MDIIFFVLMMGLLLWLVPCGVFVALTWWSVSKQVANPHLWVGVPIYYASLNLLWSAFAAHFLVVLCTPGTAYVTTSIGAIVIASVMFLITAPAGYLTIFIYRRRYRRKTN